MQRRDEVYIGKRMLEVIKQKIRRLKRKCKDGIKGDMMLVGVREKDKRDTMETENPLCTP